MFVDSPKTWAVPRLRHYASRTGALSPCPAATRVRPDDVVRGAGEGGSRRRRGRGRRRPERPRSHRHTGATGTAPANGRRSPCSAAASDGRPWRADGSAVVRRGFGRGARTVRSARLPGPGRRRTRSGSRHVDEPVTCRNGTDPRGSACPGRPTGAARAPVRWGWLGSRARPARRGCRGAGAPGPDLSAGPVSALPSRLCPHPRPPRTPPRSTPAPTPNSPVPTPCRPCASRFPGRHPGPVRRPPGPRSGGSDAGRNNLHPVAMNGCRRNPVRTRRRMRLRRPARSAPICGNGSHPGHFCGEIIGYTATVTVGAPTTQ